MNQPRFYVVRDGERVAWLATAQADRLYVYVPSWRAFVYNGPLSVDYLFDREMAYDSVTAATASQLAAAAAEPPDGVLAKLRAESRRIPADTVLIPES